MGGEVKEMEEVEERETKKWATLKERVGSLRTQLSFPQENLEEDREEDECEALRQAWMRDFSHVFKEDLTIEDRINIPPVQVKLVENSQDIPVFHPKCANEIPAYLRDAADRELNRMVAGGLLEKVDDYSETVSRGFFVPKKTEPGEEVRVMLVADFRGVNLRLQRPEYPLDNSNSILKRLRPGDRYFAAIDMSSGFSQIALDKDSRELFTIILPQGKYRFCVLPQGLSISPEVFDLSTSTEIRNTSSCFKNADDVLGCGRSLKELDVVMRKIFTVCQTRGIKLAPSKLQVGRKLKWGGVMVESIGHRDGRADVLISPEQSKLDEFLNLERPQSKKDVQQICGLAAQMKRWCPGMQVTYPGMQRLTSANVYFQWNLDLDKELEELKQALREHVKISPVDVKRNLILVIDSAPSAILSNLMLQQKGDDPALGMNFIALDSSNFKKGQLNMCPFEAEVAGMRFAIRKEHHFLVACPMVTVITDCASLGPAYQKPWEEIKNGRVMKMFMDCSHVNLTFKHIT